MHGLGDLSAAQVLEGERHDLHRGAGIAHLAPGLAVGAAQTGRDLQRAQIGIIGAALDLRVLAEEGRQQPQVVGVQPSARLRRAMQRHHPPGLERPRADLLEDPLLVQRCAGPGAPRRQLRDLDGWQEGRGGRPPGRRRRAVLGLVEVAHRGPLPSAGKSPVRCVA